MTNPMISAQSINVLASDTERAMDDGDIVFAYRLAGHNGGTTLVEFQPITRQDWVRELRSGIRQTTGALWRPLSVSDAGGPGGPVDAFIDKPGECCLGVGTRLCGAGQEVSLDVGKPEGLNMSFARRFYESVGLLDPGSTDDAVRAAGKPFVFANDEAYLTFGEIADGLDFVEGRSPDAQAAGLTAYFKSLDASNRAYRDRADGAMRVARTAMYLL